MAKTVFFGFAIADGMFNGNLDLHREELTVDEAKALIAEGVVPCLNPSHKASIDAMTVKFGIEVEIPATPPQVKLAVGDSIIVMGVRGLPRLTDRHEYSAEEVASATFNFSRWTVTG